MRFLIIMLVVCSVWAIVPAKNRTSDSVSNVDPLYKELVQTKAYPKNPRNWAFIVAVENYDETDPVRYSRNSGMLFKLMAEKRLGVGSRRMYALIGTQASTGRIIDKLDQLVSNVTEGDTIFFYYSGHGVPIPEENNEPYILPKDKVPSNLSRTPDLKLSNIYKKLANSDASKVIAFVDSCFSGATDQKSLFKGAASPRLRAKKVSVDQAKMSVLTAGKDKQFSNMFERKKHRLFSYYLMKGIIENNLRDVESLHKYVKRKVHNESFEMGDAFIQIPTISGNSNIHF